MNTTRTRSTIWSWFLRYGENNPDYQKLKQDIDDYFGFPASQRLVFYASPCTMLIIANHFAEEDEEPIRLGKVSKSDNGDLLLQHGVKIPDPPYGAKQEQRKALMDAVTKANYRVMKNKVAAFKGPDTDCPLPMPWISLKELNPATKGRLSKNLSIGLKPKGNIGTNDESPKKMDLDILSQSNCDQLIFFFRRKLGRREPRNCSLGRETKN